MQSVALVLAAIVPAASLLLPAAPARSVAVRTSPITMAGASSNERPVCVLPTEILACRVAAAAAVDAKTVKSLRDATGAGMMDCKKALVENEGNMEAAMEYLRKKGMATADKKAGRQAKEGIVETYVHTGGWRDLITRMPCVVSRGSGSAVARRLEAWCHG